MTTVYLIRHSKALRKIQYNGENLQSQNEKNVLSIEGEEMAKKFSENEIFSNLDKVISSHYVRAISTAKYLANHCGKELIVMSEFGERKHGVGSWDELPKDFEIRQLEDAKFKVLNGESRDEVTKRMHDGLASVLESAKNKNIAIISHATAITFLLLSYGKYINNQLVINDKVLFDKDFSWDNLDTIKLVFDENNNLIDFTLLKNSVV